MAAQQLLVSLERALPDRPAVFAAGGTDRQQMILGSWFVDPSDGCLTRFLVGAPADAKGKSDTIVAHAVAEFEAREAARRAKIAEDLSKTKPRFEIVERDPDKYVSVNAWSAISFESKRRRQSALA
jgi:hypothetical protein